MFVSFFRGGSPPLTAVGLPSAPFLARGHVRFFSLSFSLSLFAWVFSWGLPVCSRGPALSLHVAVGLSFFPPSLIDLPAYILPALCPVAGELLFFFTHRGALFSLLLLLWLRGVHFLAFLWLSRVSPWYFVSALFQGITVTRSACAASPRLYTSYFRDTFSSVRTLPPQGLCLSLPVIHSAALWFSSCSADSIALRPLAPVPTGLSSFEAVFHLTSLLYSRCSVLGRSPRCSSFVPPFLFFRPLGPCFPTLRSPFVRFFCLGWWLASPTSSS